MSCRRCLSNCCLTWCPSIKNVYGTQPWTRYHMIIFITSLQGIYRYVPETNHVSTVYIVATVSYLQPVSLSNVISHVNLLKPKTTLCTTSFNGQKFCVLLVMRFTWISEQTTIISLCSINWMVFITDRVFTARYGLGLCALCGSEIRQRLFTYASSTECFYKRLFTPRYGQGLCVGLKTNKQLFPYIALTDLFLLLRQWAFTARYGLGL
jgi:hypothetical protein